MLAIASIAMAFALALAGLQGASQAHAAGPGETLLVSGPPGLGPLDPALGGWNVSGDQGGTPPVVDVTPDGRYAVFGSDADGLLAPGEDPGPAHVFRKDLRSGELVQVDAGATASSAHPTISDDGRRVAFASNARLSGDDPSPDADVYVKDLVAGTATLVTLPTVGVDDVSGLNPVISGNGQRIVFTSNAHLLGAVPGPHVYVGFLGLFGLLPVDVKNDDAPSNGIAFGPSISADGNRVAFMSTATDIAPGDDPFSTTDLYVRDVAQRVTFLASAQDGLTFGLGSGSVSSGQISGDGLSAVFSDDGSYLPTDTNTNFDVYQRVFSGRSTRLVSVTQAGEVGNGTSRSPAIDTTGHRIAFTSDSSNMGAAAGVDDLVVRDVGGRSTLRLTTQASASSPAISDGDAANVVFASLAPLAEAPRTPSAVHRIDVSGATPPSLVSVRAGADPPVPGLTGVDQPNFGDTRRLSENGRFAVFASEQPALPAPPGPQAVQCYRRDQRTGELLVVSIGPLGAARECREPSISNDGTRVAFVARGQITADDPAQADSVYVRDLVAGTTTLASRADGPGGADANQPAQRAQISGDGTKVVFDTDATNLGAPGGTHVFVRDLAAGTTRVADRVAATGAVSAGVEFFSPVSISGDGARVVFSSAEPLVVSDANSDVDVYVGDLTRGTTLPVNVQSTAIGGGYGAKASAEGVLSDDGSHIVFLSMAENLDPNLAPWPAGTSFQVFLRDLDVHATKLVSRNAAGRAAQALYFAPTIDGKGSAVAFGLDAGPTDYTPSARANEQSVVVVDTTGDATAIIRTPPADALLPQPQGPTWPFLSGDGNCLAFISRGRGIVPVLSPDYLQMFARPLRGSCGTVAPPEGEPPGGSPAGGAGTRLAPRLSRVSLTHKRFRVARATTSRRRRGVRAPVGTTFRFTLNTTATVRISMVRLGTGRRGGRRCLPATPALRRKPPCVRRIAVGAFTRRDLAAGARTAPFSGRIERRALAPGHYRATLTAQDREGAISPPITVAFTVIR